MIKMSVLALFIVLLFSSNQVGAQDVNIISGNQSNQPVQTAVPDTFPLLDLEETELDKIPDLRAQFEKLNSSYSSPAAPSTICARQGSGPTSWRASKSRWTSSTR